MKNIVNFYIEKFKADHRKSRCMFSLLLTLALLVAAGIFWQLHSAGIALTNETDCGLEEHIHTEDCYDEEGTLICGLAEHTHTEACISDITADTETAEDWEATLPELTGVWANDVVAIAESQLGYTESTANYILADDGVTRKGYTRYGAWAGNAYGDWDAMFASFCLYYAGISTDEFPESTGAYAWVIMLQEQGLYAGAEDYSPAAGDLIFFDTDEDGRVDSVGIVSGIDEEENTLSVIEGDSDDAVCRDIYNQNDSMIAGYGTLTVQQTAAAEDGEEAQSEGKLAAVEEAEAIEGEETEEEEETEKTGETEAAGENAVGTQKTLTEESSDATEEAADDSNRLILAASDDGGETDDGDSGENTDPTTDLEEYIESVNKLTDQSASITLTLRTESDSDITEEDGSKIVTTNTKYHLALTIYSSAGFEANTTYTYSLPEGVAVEAASGSITVEDGTVIGTWTVSDNGTVTLEFNDKASEYQDVEITFTATATIDTTEETITIGDTTYTVSETTNLAVNKSGSYSGYTKTDYYYGRTYEIEFSQSGVSLARTKVTDYATDTQYSLLYTGGDISYDNQHFDTSTPLVITIVDASGATVYTWTIDWSDSNLTLYTLDDDGNVVETTSISDRIIGWQYTFPDTVSATDSSGNTVTVDLTTADWSPYEIHITSKTIFDEVPSDDNPRVTYHNWVEVDNGVEQDTAHVSVAQSTGTYSLRKDWSRGEDDVSVDWTITATIPGGTVASYEISDNLYVDKMTTENYQVFLNTTTNRVMTITISEGTTINGTEIAAGTYTVYDISGEVPEDALFVYNCVTSTSGFSAYFVLGMVCHCDEDCCDGWNGSACNNILYTSTSGTTYCTCWQLDQSASIQLTYTTPKDKMLELLSRYGYSTSKLYNYADLRTGTYNGDRSLTGTSLLGAYTVNVGLALAAKTLTEAPSSDNDYTASYEVVINTNHYALTENGEDLTITDTLSSSLTFLSSSLVIHATDAGGNTTTLTSDDYTYSYDSDTHVITITIKNPGTNSYTITYDAQMLNPNSGATYSNSLGLSWQGEDVTVETDTSYLSEVTTTGTTYMVTILKTDETTGSVLAGAEFNLCNADGTVKATGTTDENGQVTFKTVSGAGEDSLTLAAHTLYYLEETEAPEGYEKDSTKHYFCFCDYSGEGTCETCSSMTLPNGVTSDEVTTLTYGGVITITNAQTTYGFTIRKVDSEDSTKTLTGAEFYIYYKSAVLDAEGNPTGEMNQYYAVLGEGNAITGWNSSTDRATKLVVGENGTVSINGLPAGTYYLEEITAPDGYNLLSDPIKITVGSDGTISVLSGNSSAEVSKSNGIVTLVVKNVSGYELPSTGGAGTWMFGLIGMILCGGPCLALYRHRKTLKRTV